MAFSNNGGLLSNKHDELLIGQKGWVSKTQTMEYCSAIKKNEMLSFATIWMDLNNPVLTEISQRKTTTVRSHLFVESKTN